MDMIDVDIYDIDGIEYIELKKIEINGNTYIILFSREDNNNVLVQKLEIDEMVDVDENTKEKILTKFIQSVHDKI